MDSGKKFEALIKLAATTDMQVKFFGLNGSYGRLNGDRIGLNNRMTIDNINYTFAHELAHSFLHANAGDTINSDKHEEYEMQADCAARFLLHFLDCTDGWVAV